jgi:hypothetical protein
MSHGRVLPHIKIEAFGGYCLQLAACESVMIMKRNPNGSDGRAEADLKHLHSSDESKFVRAGMARRILFLRCSPGISIFPLIEAW